MRFAIIKCHGSGNDFPLIDARGLDVPDADWPAVARALADRTGPVGGDGLLLLKPPRDDAAFGFAMYNPDGTEAETCLNGLRCVARLGFEQMGGDTATVSLVGSTAQVSRVADLAPGVYTVREVAGPASLDVTAWPMAIGRHDNVERVIELLPSTRAFTAVSIPNPHLIAFVDHIEEGELVAVGLACEAAPAWLPRRANVSFVEVRGPALFVRTHERGVGLTHACGSAMAASTYAAALTGRIAFDLETTVFNRGGLVRASAGAAGVVAMAGNATWEWAGSVEVDLAPGLAHDLRVEHRFDAERAAWAEVVRQAG
jgi:diaminopimelate epimerase